jgi:hypothetical protein
MTMSSSPAAPRRASSSGSSSTRPDWTWACGPVTGTALAALGAFTLAYLFRTVHLPAWWPLALAVLPATATAILGAHHRTARRVVVFRVGCWLVAGAWVAWATHATRWSAPYLVALAAVALFAGLLAPAFATHHARDLVAESAKAAKAKLPRALEWEARIQRVANIAVDISCIDDWPNGAGFTITAGLPLGGATWRTLGGSVEGLAADARLPMGCEVTAMRGADRGQVVLQVSTVNALAKLHYWDDLSRISIYDDLPIGVLRDSAQALINLRYHCAVLVGQVDAGKSNQLHAINTQLARCDDVVIWHIETSGGGLPRPYCAAWHEGRAPVPTVDWAALTDAEANIMCDAAIAIIEGRKPAYHARMRDAGEDKLPVGSDVPQIVIVVDELAKLPRIIKEKLATISDTGRGAGVRLVSCALRAVDDYLPIPLKEQARVRIGMRVSAQKELAYLFGWEHPVDPDAAPYAGCGFLFQGDEVQSTLVPFRGHRAGEPQRVDRVSVSTAGYRPTLDQVSVDLANPVIERGDAYSGRWRRMLPRMFPGCSCPLCTSLAGARPSASATAGGNSTVASPAPRVPVVRGDTPAEIAEQAKRRARAAVAMARIRQGDPVDDTFAALVGGLDLEAPDADGAQADPAPTAATGAALAAKLDMVVRIVDKAGADGLASQEIGDALAAAGVQVSRQHRQKWLKTLVEEVPPRVTYRPVRAGESTQSRYVTPRHLEGQ